MNYLKLENFLVNLSFFLLFASMLYYWIQLVFFSNIFKPESDSGTPLVRSEPYHITDPLDSVNPNYDPLLGHAVAITNTFDKQKGDAHKQSSLVGLWEPSTLNLIQANQTAVFPQIEDLNRVKEGPWRSPIPSRDSPNLQPLKKITNIHYGQLLVFLANLTMLILLLDRWLESGHFPLSNLYESLIFLSWSLTSINLWLEKIQPSGLKTFFPSIKNNLGFEKYINWWNSRNFTSLIENTQGGPYNRQPEPSSGTINSKKEDYSTLLVKEPTPNENLQSLIGQNRQPITLADPVLLLRRDRSRNYFDVGPSDPTERAKSAVQHIIDVSSPKVEMAQSEPSQPLHPKTSVLMNDQNKVLITRSISSKKRAHAGLDSNESISGYMGLKNPSSNNNKSHKSSPELGWPFFGFFETITTDNKDNKINYIFGGIITPIALIIHAFASFSLPSELREATSLVPALQSNWLIMHVTVIMLSYAALLAGCLFSLVFLLFDIFFSGHGFEEPQNTTDFKESTKFNYIFMDSKNTFNKADDFETQPISNRLEFSPTINVDPKNVTEIAERDRLSKINQPPQKPTDIKDVLDNLSYRTIGIGFLLLTIGIFSGAVWANEAWGSYWSWDPKETWALITWLIFAIYLHARLQLSWPRKKAAMIACSGFVVVWICYLGVNLLGQGLHSYGFIKIGK